MQMDVFFMLKELVSFFKLSEKNRKICCYFQELSNNWGMDGYKIVIWVN